MQDFIGEKSIADSWPGVLLLFALFLLFFAATAGYGALLRRALRLGGGLLDGACDQLALGSAALFGSAFVLSSLHLLRTLPGWAYALAFVPGLVASARPAAALARAALSRHRLALAVSALVFGVRALSAALPARHGDPLLYHLLGPRLWTEAGGFLMHANLPNALLASSWECLYVWPQLFFFSRSALFGLVEAQIFSQWLHLFLAWGGCALLTLRLFRGSARADWLPLAALAALFVAGLQWTAPLAKNDAGITFWSLAAVVYFAEARRERSGVKAGLSGVFAGLAVCGKITALVSLAPLLGALALTDWRTLPRRWRELLAWAAGFVAGAVPIYARNALLSGNPFFPLFPKLFPSPWISKSWEAHFAQVHPSSPLHSLGRMFTRFPELLKETPFAAGAAALLALALAKDGVSSVASRERFALLAGAFVAYLAFTATQAPEIELRYLGASLLVLAGGGVCFLLRLAELLPERKARYAAGALLVALLATSRLPLHLLRKIWDEPLGVAYVRTHSAGEAKSWLRARGDGFVVVAGDNETYYLTPVSVAVLTERPDLDAANAKTDFPSFLKELCTLSRARWLLDARPAIGVEARFGQAALAPALVFHGQGANVYDLRRLGCP